MGAAPMEVNYGENAAGTMLYDDFVTNSDQAEKQTQQNNWVEDFDEHKTKQGLYALSVSILIRDT